MTAREMPKHWLAGLPYNPDNVAATYQDLDIFPASHIAQATYNVRYPENQHQPNKKKAYAATERSIQALTLETEVKHRMLQEAQWECLQQ